MKAVGKHDRVGIILLVLAILMGLASFLGLASLQNRARQRDAADRNPLVTGTLRSTAIVLDVTDALTVDQAMALGERMRAVEEFELHRGELVSLWTVGGPEGELRRWFCGRFPGRSANSFSENPRHVVERCESLFSYPFSRALAAAITPARAARSPIAACIAEIGEIDVFSSTIRYRRLILISDLLENTSHLSFYREGTRSLVASTEHWIRENRADLDGVDVEVLGIVRPGVSVSDRAALRKHWRRYFAASGASGVRFGGLP